MYLALEYPKKLELMTTAVLSGVLVRRICLESEVNLQR
jgi:hypothetical protein